MMLCHGHRHRHRHQPTVLLPPNPSTVLPFCGILFSRKPLLFSSVRAALDSKHHLQPLEPDAETDPARLSRRQNALLLHRSHSHPIDGPPIDDKEREDELTRKKVVEEYSLATRRVPRFPGSIDFPRAGGLDLPPPDLRRVFDGDDRSLKRALEVRRGVAAETLKDALRAGKMSINYSTNLVSRLSEFVDRVVIGAATLKAVPEFAHLSFNSRAKSYIQSSCVVSLVKWLKHNHLTYPQIAKVICMCPGDLQQVRRIAEWLKSIHVKGESIGVVLVKAGPVFERSLDELEEIVNYLENNGVRKDWMGFVVSRCPQVLGLTMEELESRVKFYLDMGMNAKDFGTMVFDYPRALGFFSLEEMANKVFVQYLKEFGLSTEDVGRLLAFKPHLMGCSIEERWRPLVKYLYYLGVQRDGMKRILIVKPVVFCIDLETTIAPKFCCIKVVFLMTKAGVTQKDIGKVIALDPQLVGCSITKKLDINVKYFLSLGIHFQSLGEMIADFPMLLRYNIDILRPKYKYLRRVMVRPLQDLIEFPR
ncbi:hypothetical protein B296_00008347 [Ensete ventricosum]|uniref:mTERF domain-containing protein, mitochondrial n=1 Tax=Ensete ventricosum TaxID=4639 RepID=A0A427B5T4_ENSVE|nr:hypothetical protein B296_00008347 [Ensete ventricosum]